MWIRCCLISFLNASYELMTWHIVPKKDMCVDTDSNRHKTHPELDFLAPKTSFFLVVVSSSTQRWFAPGAEFEEVNGETLVVKYVLPSHRGTCLVMIQPVNIVPRTFSRFGKSNSWPENPVSFLRPEIKSQRHRFGKTQVREKQQRTTCVKQDQLDFMNGIAYVRVRPILRIWPEHHYHKLFINSETGG